MCENELIPGCWVDVAQYGPAVLIYISESGTAAFRYEATHQATGQTIWVFTMEREFTFLGPPDDVSKHVLTLEGPYGLGFDCSDPRRPSVGGEIAL